LNAVDGSAEGPLIETSIRPIEIFRFTSAARAGILPPRLDAGDFSKRSRFQGH
jgi:hypothetical protein